MRSNDSMLNGGTIERAEFGRRDALKAIAALAGAPLYSQAGRVGGAAAGQIAAVVENKRGQPFDDSWRFLRGDAQGAERPAFDDRSWRLLDLPHDFSVEDLPPRASD